MHHLIISNKTKTNTLLKIILASSLICATLPLYIIYYNERGFCFELQEANNLIKIIHKDFTLKGKPLPEYGSNFLEYEKYGIFYNKINNGYVVSISDTGVGESTSFYSKDGEWYNFKFYLYNCEFDRTPFKYR